MRRRMLISNSVVDNNLMVCTMENLSQYKTAVTILSNNSYIVKPANITNNDVRTATFNCKVEKSRKVLITFDYERKNIDVVSRYYVWSSKSLTAMSGTYLHSDSFGTQGSKKTTVTTEPNDYLGISIYLNSETIPINEDAEITISNLKVEYVEE